MPDIVVPGLDVLLRLGQPHKSDYMREQEELASYILDHPIAGGASDSDYLENKLNDHVNGKTSFTMPATPYLALCTSVPDDTKTGTTIVEANYTGYARKAVAGADWNASASGTSTTANVLTFAACTSGSSTIIGWAYCDAATVGNMLYWGTATSTVISTTQTPATIAAGGLSSVRD